MGLVEGPRIITDERFIRALQFQHDPAGVVDLLETATDFVPGDVPVTGWQVIVESPAIVVRMDVDDAMARDLDEAAPVSAEVQVPRVQADARVRANSSQQPGKLVGMAADEMRQWSLNRQG